LGTTAVWAQAAPVSSAASESEAAKAYRLGIDLVKAGQVDKAISTFEDGLRSDPQSTVLLNVIGATYILKGNFEQAEGYLLKCLQTDPGFVPARKNLAISYFDSGKYNLAVPEFEKLIKTPGESRSVAFLGIIAESGTSANPVAAGRVRGWFSSAHPQALLSCPPFLTGAEGRCSWASLTRCPADGLRVLQSGPFIRRGQYHRPLAQLDRAEKGIQVHGARHQRAPF
jgi:tetratricopeptide (TPR) repeat protein